LLIVICSPAIGVAIGVFVATTAACGGSTAVAAAAAAMPAAVGKAWLKKRDIVLLDTVVPLR
jgi:hypothetical protein